MLRSRARDYAAASFGRGATMSFLSSYARRSEVDSLTNSKDAPIPMFALEEFASGMAKSDDGVVNDVAKYLCASRVEHKNPVVKLKALKVAKHVASRQGCASFRRALQQNSGHVRTAVTFRCNPDPLKGTKPAEAVREAAKEAIHAIFSTDARQGGPAGRAQMQGFGSAGPNGHANGHAKANGAAGCASLGCVCPGGKGGILTKFLKI